MNGGKRLSGTKNIALWSEKLRIYFALGTEPNGERKSRSLQGSVSPVNVICRLHNAGLEQPKELRMM